MYFCDAAEPLTPHRAQRRSGSEAVAHPKCPRALPQGENREFAARLRQDSSPRRAGRARSHVKELAPRDPSRRAFGPPGGRGGWRADKRKPMVSASVAGCGVRARGHRTPSRCHERLAKSALQMDEVIETLREVSPPGIRPRPAPQSPRPETQTVCSSRPHGKCTRAAGTSSTSGTVRALVQRLNLFRRPDESFALERGSRVTLESEPRKGLARPYR